MIRFSKTAQPAVADRPWSLSFLAWITAGGALLAYSPALGSYPVSDDFVLLAAARDPWGVHWTLDGRWFRPVSLAFWKLTAWLVGSSAPAHHLFSLGVHLLNSFLVYRLGRALFGERRAGAVAGAVFCLFPTHPEAVTWLSGRFDLLCACFYLLSLLCLIRHLEEGRALWAGLSVLCGLAALLSKEMALSLPLASLAVIRWRRPDLGLWQAVRRVLPLAGVMSVVVGGRLLATGSLGGYSFQFRSDWSSLRLLWSPLEVFLFPWNRALLDSGLWWAGLLFSAVTAVHVWGLTRVRDAPRQALFLTLLLYLLALPLVNLDRVYANLQGSRYYYLPAVVFALWLAVCLTGRKHSPGPLLPAYLLLLATLLFAHNLPWREAGRQSRLIVEQLGELTAEARRLDRIPDHFLGAYVFRNGLDAVGRSFSRVRGEICWRTNESDAWQGRCEPAAANYRWTGRQFEREPAIN